MISGVCESGDCTSFSVLEVLCLVPVVLGLSFKLWNDVVVNLHDPPSSRSFSTSSSPLANLASRLNRALIPEYAHLYWLVSGVSGLAENQRVCTNDFGGTMTFHADICASIGLGMAFRRRRSYVVSDCSFASVDPRKEQCLRPSLPRSA